MVGHLTKDDIRFEKLSNYYQQYMYQCKRCGRKEVIPPFKKKTICTWCGNYIYRNKRDEFEERLKNTMRGK